MSKNQTIDKWVSVMADYSSDGLWCQDGVMMDRADLPISSELAEKHAAWCQRFEASEFYLSEEERQSFDVAVFAEDGLEIARAIKAELPEWSVFYFDERKSINPEYEIHAVAKEILDESSK